VPWEKSTRFYAISEDLTPQEFGVMRKRCACGNALAVALDVIIQASYAVSYK
jgi:hypothetical protein